jgi:hypothetical protein
VAEDSLKGTRERVYHGFFSQSLHGRLEQLVCLDDTVQVGMNGVVIDGRESRDGTVEFEILHPWRYKVNRAGSHMGHRIAYDERRDALFYVPEWGQGIVRFHRATGRLNRDVKSWATRRPPFLGRFRDSYELGQESIHRQRDSVFFAEWIGGTDAYEVSLESLQVLGIFPHNNGGSVGITVDEDYNRIYVVGLWGMAAWNLSDKRVFWKSRLGLLPRLPVIDTRNDLILVPSTVGGRITIFDRRTLDFLGTIPVGFGVRLLHVSPTQDRLYASSSRAAYFWPTSEIAGKIGVSRSIEDSLDPHLQETSE